MKPTDEVIDAICASAKKKTEVRGASGYKKFDFVRETNNAIYLMRENGNLTKITHSTLTKAIEAVRRDRSVYSQGPGALRAAAEITHVTSPTWALLRSVTLNDLIE